MPGFNLVRAKLTFDDLVLLVLVAAGLGSAVSFGKIYSFHIAAAVMLFVASVSGRRFPINKKGIETGLHFFLGWMFFWYALTMFWAIDTGYAARYLGYIFCGVIVTWTIVTFCSDEERLNKVFRVLSWTFLLDVVIGFLEVFTDFRLPSSSLNTLNAELTYSNRALDYIASQPTGLHFNPNDFGTVLSMAFPFFLVHRKLAVRVVGCCACIFLIVQTGSRANILSLGLILLGAFVVFRLSLLIKLLSYLAGALVVGFMLMTVLPANSELNRKVNEAAKAVDVASKIIGGDSSDKGSELTRMQLIKNGLDALVDSGGIGVGGGGSVAVQERAQVDGMNIKSMHNFWIEVLVDGGVLFAVVFYAWYLMLLFEVFRVIRSTKISMLKFLAAGCFLSLLGFFAGAVSPSSVIYFFPMWLLFGLSIAVVRQSCIERSRAF